MYNHTHRTDTVSSALSRTSHRSDESYTSQLSTLTAATSVCADDLDPLPPLTRQPQLRHISTRITHASTSSFRSCTSSPRSSTLYAEPEEYSYDDFPPPSYTPPSPPAAATPTTPHDFAHYFPSPRRLTISHDPSSPDHSHNLLITTTPDSPTHKTPPLQLFHLRMHDIPTRAFSLRRYCRDSGREVCHSALRGARSPARNAAKLPKHPKLQRSMSTALATVARAGVKRADSWGAASSHKASYPPPLLTIPTRNDSGYETYFDDDDDFSTSGSEDGEEEEEEVAPVPATAAQKGGGKTNTTHLEFSNYAHVDVTRRGSRGGGKHWDFEYWGTLYSWKREGESYHLVPSSSSSSSGGGGGAVAHIVPDVLTPSETLSEAREGGWVPKCSFWISDAGILEAGGDVADVVVATGLMALVDDKARAEERGGQRGGRVVRRIRVPMSPVKLDLEVVGAREMMRSVFGRGGGRGDERERPGTGTARKGGSGLRFGRAVEAC